MKRDQHRGAPPRSTLICVAAMYGLWLAAMGVMALLPAHAGAAPGAIEPRAMELTGLSALHQDLKSRVTVTMRQLRAL